MQEILTFGAREDFRLWLAAHATGSEGVWLLFGKKGGPQTLTAAEALEEALCFGWIDGQMQSMDEKTYRKYFSPRRPKSKWSEKNKALAGRLAREGKMTPQGLARIEEAKQNGQWDAVKAPAITQTEIDALSACIKGHEPAYTHFQAMPPSVQKTYTRAYLDAKTDAGREKRLAWILGRLDQNLRPM